MIANCRVYPRINSRGQHTEQPLAHSKKELPLSDKTSCAFLPSHQHPPLRLKAIASIILVISGPIFATAQQTQTSSDTVQYEFKPQTPYPTDGLSLAFPTVALFIGVSDYGEAAKVTSTPAHSLGAAVMYDTFVGAAANAENKALFIPSVNYFKGGAEAICGLVFSPDQSYIASGSKDGTVTLWSGTMFGSVIGASKRKGNACALAFSPDSSELVAGGSDGDAVIQPIKANKAPIVLKHPACVCSAAFSPDGSKILTTSLDGATRIWEAGGTKEPLVLQAEQVCASGKAEEEQCADAPVAAFSPDGKSVVTSSCKTLRLWNLDHPGEPALLGEDTASIHSVSFLPDGSEVVSGTDKGVTRWPVKQAHQPDGRDAPSTPHGIHIDSREAIRSLQLSHDGQYALFNTESGGAWMEVLKGAHKTLVPRPDREGQGGFTIGFAIDQGTIPSGRKRSRIEAAALSPDARYVVAGYDDGSIGIHPGINLPEGRAFRADNQFLLADLKFDKTATSIMAIWYLRQLHGGSRDLVYNPPKDRPDDSDDPRFLQLGRGEPVTRQRIFSALTAAIERAEQTAALQQNAVLVVYVAAHGWIGTDGRQYFLPADANSSNAGTWIAFDDFLSPIKAFLTVPSRDRSDGPDRAAVVIFDTCQTRLGSSQTTPTVSSTDEPINLFVIETTSPGQYAWHWTGNLESTEFTSTDSWTRRFGVTHKDRPKHTESKSDYSFRMSMFPYASHWALNSLIKHRSQFATPDKRKIPLSEWIVNTQDAMTALEEGIPEVKETGQAQTVRVRNSKLRFAIFEVEQNASTPR